MFPLLACIVSNNDKLKLQTAIYIYFLTVSDSMMSDRADNPNMASHVQKLHPPAASQSIRGQLA